MYFVGCIDDVVLDVVVIDELFYCLLYFGFCEIWVFCV